MKRMRVIILVGMFVLLFELSASAGCLTLISPNGGETLKLKSKYTIKWNETCQKPFQVKIILRNSTGFVGVIGSVSVTSSLGTEWYEWEVGKLTNGYAGPGSDYKVVVKIAGEPSQKDASDNFFSITYDKPLHLQRYKEYRKFVPPNEPVEQKPVAPVQEGIRQEVH